MLDVGPHILDLVEAALGPVVELTAQGDPQRLGRGPDAPRRAARAATSRSRARARSSRAGPRSSSTVASARSRSTRAPRARAESFARLRAEFAAVARTGDRIRATPHAGSSSSGSSTGSSARSAASGAGEHRARRRSCSLVAAAGAAIGIRHLYLRLDRPGGVTCSLRVAHGDAAGTRAPVPRRLRRTADAATCSGAGWRGPGPGIVFPVDRDPGRPRTAARCRGERWRVPASFSVLPVELADGVVLELAVPRHRLRKLVALIDGGPVRARLGSLRSVPTEPLDVVVIGGGHNGLVAAGLLAKQGARVTVLERRDVVGGAAISEQPWGPDFT